MLEIRMIANFVSQLAKKNDPLFRLGVNKWNGHTCIYPKNAGAQFIKMIDAGFDHAFQTYPEHDLDPRFTLVVNAASARNLRNFASRMNVLPESELVRLLDALNGCVANIRDTANSAAFKASLRKFQRPAEKNQKELEHYIRRQVSKHGHLRALRIDLGYRINDADDSGSEAKLTLNDVKADWKRFYDAIEQQLPAGAKLGFARKIKFTPAVRGNINERKEKQADFAFRAVLPKPAKCQIRLLVLCDPSVITDDFGTATLIGECWQSEAVTNGRGLFYILNPKEPSAQPTGLGLIQKDDAMGCRLLEFRARAFIAPDLYASLTGPDWRNLFIKGNMPKPEKGKKSSPLKD